MYRSHTTSIGDAAASAIYIENRSISCFYCSIEAIARLYTVYQVFRSVSHVDVRCFPLNRFGHSTEIRPGKNDWILTRGCIYTPRRGILSGVSSSSCRSCGGDSLFEPVEAWIYSFTVVLAHTIYHINELLRIQRITLGTVCGTPNIPYSIGSVATMFLCWLSFISGLPFAVEPTLPIIGWQNSTRGLI